MKPHFSIRSKLLLFMLAPALVITSLMAYFSYETLEKSYQNQIATLSMEILESSSQKVKIYLEKEIDKLEILSLNASLQAYLRGAQTDFKGKTAPEQADYFAEMDRRWEKENDASLIDPVLNNPAAKALTDFQAYEKARYREIFVTDRVGANVAATNKTSDFYQADEFWWQAAMENSGSVFLGDIEYDQSAMVHSIAIAIPVKDSQQGSIIGVMKVILDVNELFLYGAELVVGKSGLVRICNQAGKIVFDPDREYLDKLENPALLDKILGRQNGFFKTVTEHTDRFVVFMALDLKRIMGQKIVTRNLWYFCLFQDTEEAFLPLRKTQRLQMIRIAVMALLLLIGTLYLGRLFSKPLLELVRHTREISRGNFSTRIELQSKDEYRTLGEAFNQMAERLERYFRLTESSERRYKALFESAREGILVLERDTGVIVNANQSLCSALNKNRDSVVGKKLAILLGETSYPQSYQDNIRILMEDQGTREIGLLCGDFNRKSVFEVSSNVFELDHKIFVQFLFRDVTEKKQIDEIKNNLIRDVAHELRTPVAKLHISMDILFNEMEKSLPENERIQMLGHILKKSILRLGNTVESILDFSRLQEGVVYVEKESFDLRDLVAEIVNDYLDVAREKGLLLSSLLPDKAIAVEGDRRLLKMAVSNLVSNAIKFTFSGEVVVRLRRENGKAEVIVKDTGIGISSAHIAQIFDKFYQVSSSMPGCGIGLAISDEIVKLHGGRIWAESDGIGTGAIFKLELMSSN